MSSEELMRKPSDEEWARMQERVAARRAREAGAAVAPVVAPAPVQPVSVAQVESLLRDLGRKIEAQEVTPSLVRAAEQFVNNPPAGGFTFEFLAEMNRAFVQYGRLSVGQAKGVLNSWRADLLRRPTTAAVATPRVEIPTGYYAVGDEPDVRFYFVSVRERYAAVSLVVGGNPNQYIGTLGRLMAGDSRTKSDLVAIAADSKSAARFFGQKIGRCGCCGRHLTDPTSRAYGIGPECRSKGW